MDRTYRVYPTRLGLITLVCRGEEITGLFFGHRPPEGAKEESTPLSDGAFAQLEEYLAGERLTFDLPLGPEGTLFQKRVWQSLAAIPYGQTRSYGQIAARVGNPKACRAVGMANHRNPIPILIPCHRVIGKRGDLVGYAGGLEIKKYLLELEKNHI